MKVKQILGVMAVAGLAYGGGRLGLPIERAASAQPGEMAAAEPLSEQHRILDTFMGEWEGVSTFHMPGMGELRSEATISREWLLDGRFLAEEVRGEMMPGEEFVGYGVVGYNEAAGHYESFWIDNQSSAMTFETGHYNPQTKQMAFRGVARDGEGRSISTRSELDLSDPDRQVYRGYHTGVDGVEQLMFEGVWERKN